MLVKGGHDQFEDHNVFSLVIMHAWKGGLQRNRNESKSEKSDLLFIYHFY